MIKLLAGVSALALGSSATLYKPGGAHYSSVCRPTDSVTSAEIVRLKREMHSSKSVDSAS